MAKYITKNGDKAFRKVNLRNTALPKFEQIESVGQVVSYPDNLVVLEILQEDGSMQLHYNGPRMELKYVKPDDHKFAMNKDTPTERLWVRRVDGMGIPYKVPTGLPVENGRIEFQVADDVKKLELFGDQYFEKIFDLK